MQHFNFQNVKVVERSLKKGRQVLNENLHANLQYSSRKDSVSVFFFLEYQNCVDSTRD